MTPYQVVKSETTYKGKIVEVKQDVIILPNGKEAVREVVIRGEAAAVLPVDSEGRLIFVRQYRHPFGGLALEVPAGMMEEGEAPEACATRELEEETGLIAGEISHVTSMHTTIGFCTEIIHIYIARDLRQGEQKLDDEEFVEIETYTLEESLDMIRQGEITDGKTIVAIMALK